jgi:hypothetical protein
MICVLYLIKDVKKKKKTNEKGDKWGALGLHLLRLCKERN